MNDMSNPSIQQFKAFIHERPLLIKEIRQGKITLQETYEKYVLLGEEDPVWNKYLSGSKHDQQKSEEDSSSQFYQKVMKHLENVDLNQVEGHIHNLNGAIGNIVTLIDQFKQYRNSQAGQSQANDFFYKPKD
ncbi:spore coat protein YlbD [Gracilibacillus sp. S3-1-1]|uniref:Spore coat protein YlbD n=1 Tax=Gracilibacillus pellucidus TaxID=3095368 RepID=A0ACC6M2E9_9BACI|nr:spore coat protein YlbD [Gracilibacillus sp. S3-1-1]MDX8044907.1 spore coat protein YlbD [Gracilibacillus sp. S3-1-1]